MSELIEVITAIPDVEWDDVKDASLLRLLLETRRSVDAISDDAWVDAINEPFQDVPSRSFRESAPSLKRKRTTQVKSIPNAITPTINTHISPFYAEKFTVVGEQSLFLNEEKLARDQPPISMSTETTKYKVGSLISVVTSNNLRDRQETLL